MGRANVISYEKKQNNFIEIILSPVFNFAVKYRIISKNND
jgi:hypothetical protein